MKHRQSGITLVGFIVVLAVVGFFAYCAMKLFPMYSEFYSVKSSLTGLSAEAGIATKSPAKIQDLLFRRFYISYVENVTKKNVKIKRMDYGYLVTVKYEVRRPLFANLDVVGNFDTEQELRRGGSID